MSQQHPHPSPYPHPPHPSQPPLHPQSQHAFQPQYTQQHPSTMHHASGHFDGQDMPSQQHRQSHIPIDPSLIPHAASYSQPQSHPHPGPHTSFRSHLPPPYAPVDYPHPHPNAPPPIRPTISPSNTASTAGRSDHLLAQSAPPPLQQDPSTAVVTEKRKRGKGKDKETKGGEPGPSIMVYPPPPPPPGGKYDSAQVYNLPEKTNMSGNGWLHTTTPPKEWWTKSEGKHGRRPSDAEEVEASLALAGMGMGLSPRELQARRDSDEKPSAKKIKKEEGVEPNKGGKKADKDAKKSCAECRRLKAKCDRQFPCSNCRRRGCALVCPDGDLSCMQGKRLVLASTEQLHERIAQLETALFQSHSQTTSTHHPLLAPEYLDGGFASLPPPQIPLTHHDARGSTPPKHTLQRHESPPGLQHLSPKDRSSASSFQLVTPHLSAERDRASSQGRITVESLLLSEEQAAAEGKREDEWVGENAAPAMIVGTVGQSKESGNERQKVFARLNKILRVLPKREETKRRAQRFWQASAWYNSIVQVDEFDNIYEPAVYAPTPQNPLSPHKLAVVLMVLTLDNYFDVTVDEESPIIAEYWEGVQMCFDTRFGWAASVPGVQALALATLFVGFGWRGAKASNFYWLRQMTSAALQLGLHKDPHPSLPEEEREFRRRVFHESFTIDCLISINHGQRTAVQLEVIETARPANSPQRLAMKYEYMKLVKSAVIDIGCRPDSSPASKEQIASTEQYLMKFDPTVHPEMHCPALSGQPVPMDPVLEEQGSDVEAMIKCTTSMCHFKAMLFLHRPSLRRLVARLRSQPRELVSFDDQDRQTVATTYRACHAITLTSVYMARTHPKLSARCWAVWVQTFSAAVSMAALAIWCGPHLEATFVTSAYQELCEACEMIKENGSKRSMGVLSLLPILQNLVSNRYPQVVGQRPEAALLSQEGEDMLFALLGGQVDQQAPPPVQAQIAPLQQTETNYHGWNGYPPQAASAPQRHPYMGQDATGWQVSMPLVPIHPAQAANVMSYAPPVNTSIPARGQHEQAQAQAQAQPRIPGGGFQEKRVEDMSATELWARLQTFYEPSPLHWGGGVNGMVVDALGGGGMAGMAEMPMGNDPTWVDYSGMLGMGA